MSPSNVSSVVAATVVFSCSSSPLWRPGTTAHTRESLVVSFSRWCATLLCGVSRYDNVNAFPLKHVPNQSLFDVLAVSALSHQYFCYSRHRCLSNSERQFSRSSLAPSTTTKHSLGESLVVSSARWCATLCGVFRCVVRVLLSILSRQRD